MQQIYFHLIKHALHAHKKVLMFQILIIKQQNNKARKFWSG